MFAAESIDIDITHALKILSRFAKHSHWARLGPHTLLQLVELPAFVNLCNDLSAESFEFDELLMAIQNLSVSDNNKSILGVLVMVKFLLKFFTGPARCLELAASAILELTFRPEVKALFQDESLGAVAIVQAAVDLSSGAAKYSATQLMWAIQDRRSGASSMPATQQQHIMFSYSWAHQVCGVRGCYGILDACISGYLN